MYDILLVINNSEIWRILLSAPITSIMKSELDYIRMLADHQALLAILTAAASEPELPALRWKDPLSSKISS
jgi:hypothetical protein